MNEYQKQCQWLSEIYAEAAETGRKFQVMNGDYVWEEANRTPSAIDHPSVWRIKPAEPRVGHLYEHEGVKAIELTDKIKEYLESEGVNCD